MKKKYVLLLAKILTIALLLPACSLAIEEETKEHFLPGSTQNITQNTDDSMVEKWPDVVTEQPSNDEGSQQPATGPEESIPPVSSETKPGVEKEETKPEVDTQPSETTPTDAEQHKPGSMTYKEYLTLSAEERQAYVESFPSMEEAMLWYEDAKKAYDESKDNIDISGGNIDLGDIIEGMGK